VEVIINKGTIVESTMTRLAMPTATIIVTSMAMDSLGESIATQTLEEVEALRE